MKKIYLHICTGIEPEIKKIIQNYPELEFEIKAYPMRCETPFASKDEIYINDEDKNAIHLHIGGLCLKVLEKEETQDPFTLVESNCFYLFLNETLVDHYIKDGAYLMSTGWLSKWRDHFKKWQFDKKTAGEFFGESCKYLLHLDTGVLDSYEEITSELSEFLSMEVRTIPVGIDYLEAKVKELIERVKYKEFYVSTNGKVSEYAMALDLVGKLSQNLKEKEVIANTLEISNILFAPGKIYYLSYKNGNPDKLYSNFMTEVKDLSVTEELSNLNERVNSNETGGCFAILFKYNGQKLGIIKLCELSFPEYLERYMNLGIFIGEIVSLTINNARNLKKVEDQQIEIEERSRQFDTLIANLPEVVYSAKINTIRTVTFISDGIWELTEYQPSEILENSLVTFQDLIFSEDKADVDKTIKTAIAEGGNYSMEYRIITKSGKMKWVREHGTGIQNEKGEVHAIEGVISDITPRKDSEQALKEEREHLNLINRLLWHDVSNSLAVMRSGIRLYENYQDENMLQEVRKQVSKASSLITKMRQLTKSLTKDIKLESIRVRYLVMKILDNYKFPVSIHGDCNALADEALYSVIDNLISNSINHANGSKIDISLRENNGKAIIEIADDGKGIPDAIKENIFEESFKYGKTGNTGLGLYIVKKIIERYHGKVEVKDNHPNGAVFVIELNSFVE